MKPEISIMRNSKARGERVRTSLSPDGPEHIQTVEEGLAPAYIL
jgi:hypothetical protein